MKKVALTSLLAVFAAAGANAANVLDGNPLYMPEQGHFVSETSVGSHSKNGHDWTLAERFGWGVTDNIFVGLRTSMTESSFFKDFAWNEIALDAAYRLIDTCAWKLDLIGGYEVNAMRAYHLSLGDKDATFYYWTAGVRGGYMTGDWSLMAHAKYIYANSRSFNWAYDDEYVLNHNLNLGFGAHWAFSDRWSAVATADYYKVLDHYFSSDPKYRGQWNLSAGLNFNIDEVKYVGVYLTKDIKHTGDGSWDAEGGVGFGAKFGIDF